MNVTEGKSNSSWFRPGEPNKEGNPNEEGDKLSHHNELPDLTIDSGVINM